MKTNIIAEIGINHNGSIELCKKLINSAVNAGCDFVKFQKRNPALCVPKTQKSKPKHTPWGKMSYLEYKYKTEFGQQEYDAINAYCKEKGIAWFASVWDKDSVNFMKQYSTTLAGKEQVIMKIPSALITNDELVKYARKNCDYLIISTGMSDEGEIVKCIDLCQPDIIFHTNSTYPASVEELNLGYITYLKRKYPSKQIGYSGHEIDLATTFASVALGARWVERHITLDRRTWGSDQAASLEPNQLKKLVKGIREIEVSITGDKARKVLYSEVSKRTDLRGK